MLGCRVESAHDRARPCPPTVFTFPAGAPFLATLARALLSGELIPGFPSGGPLDLARATIYVPTQRAGAALAREFVAASGTTSLILPRIAPLGAFEPTDGLRRLRRPARRASRLGPPSAS